jgi:hydroxymethylpyrimidine pyrophosphatase-like HAD family hydrolase
MKILSKHNTLKEAIQRAVEILIGYHGTDKHVVFDIDDTLIFDDERQSPNLQVKHLLEVARAHNYKIHLVTAREKNAEVIKWTRDELRRHCIYHDSLALCPKKSRNSMKDVSAWKHSERAKHKVCVLSVGDQWGDFLILEKEGQIAQLDKDHGTDTKPWLIIENPDCSSRYALKLMPSN